MKTNKTYQLLMDYVNNELETKDKYIKRDNKAFRFIDKLVDAKRVSFDEESDLFEGMVEMIKNTCFILSECPFLSLDYKIIDFLKEKESEGKLC